VTTYKNKKHKESFFLYPAAFFKPEGRCWQFLWLRKGW